MGEYEPETLKKVQQLELEILNDFNKICEKHNLEYFAAGGSAIGAIRHGGFIPWDDDIDVAMDRQTFDKFMKIAETELPDKYYILNYETNPHFPGMNTHICLKGTRFLTYDIKDFKGENGIFLDLFCYDNVSDDDQLMIKQGKKAWFWNKLMILVMLKEPTLFYFGLKKIIIRFVLKLIHFILKICGIKSQFCYKKALSYTKKYKNEDTKRMAYLFNTTKLKPIINKSDIYPTKKMKFENTEIRVPNDIDKYLTESFGDYMTLPPKEQRHNHKPFYLDFGPYK